VQPKEKANGSGKHVNINAAAFAPRGSLKVVWHQWQKYRKDASFNVPQKKSVSMQSLKGALPDILIAERIDPETIVVRLSGTRLDDMMGFVVSGKNLLDVVPQEQRNRINTTYNNISDFSCGFNISEDVSLSNGSNIELDILALPLTDTEGQNKFFLAGYHFTNKHFFNPFADTGVLAQNREINQVGYIDLGYGIPKY